MKNVKNYKGLKDFLLLQNVQETEGKGQSWIRESFMLLSFLVSKLPISMFLIQAILIFSLSMSFLILAYTINKIMSLKNLGKKGRF